MRLLIALLCLGFVLVYCNLGDRPVPSAPPSSQPATVHYEAMRALVEDGNEGPANALYGSTTSTNAETPAGTRLVKNMCLHSVSKLRARKEWQLAPEYDTAFCECLGTPFVDREELQHLSQDQKDQLGNCILSVHNG